jgi:hypothetical protein
MTNRERFLIGGVGGLAPVLMFLVTADFERFSSDFHLFTAIGYCVRTLILFFIGGFVVCLYRDEEQRMKLFQLGLGAPAMIAGFLVSNSSAISAPHSLIAVVHAQSHETAEDIKQFTAPAPSGFEQFVEGLTGARRKNVWFVIAGSFSSADRAKAYAREINRKFGGFHADTYAPYMDNPNYAVVIGANLTQPEAKALRNKAVGAGMPQTYYKTFPNLPVAK